MNFGHLISQSQVFDEQRAQHYDQSMAFLRDVVAEVTQAAEKNEATIEQHWDQKALAQRLTSLGAIHVVLVVRYPSPGSENTSGTGAVTLHIAVRRRSSGEYELLLPRERVTLLRPDDAVAPIVAAYLAELKAEKDQYIGA